MSRTLTRDLQQYIGKTVTLEGWADTKRDHGKITFVDLRDWTGLVQCVGFQKMGEITTESVIEITGLVKERSANLINDKVTNGNIEIDVQDYRILNKASELPIAVAGDGLDINEESRLRFRYLDLRRQRLQKTMRMRSQVVRELSNALYDQDFVEIETPMLTKSTKEGARDFIVPSRFQPGKFYALPQSPQQYKQLLMTAGFERYFQVARCIRDEDLRADRGFEFTQLDLEMSFVNREDVMNTVETAVKQAVKAVGGKLQQENFPVVTYQEAMEKYGADRFDLRTEAEKADGTLAFAWVIDFPFFKKVDTSDAAEIQDGKSGWTFTHNPFSRPLDEYVEDHLAGKNVGEILTTQYDLVCNGFEVGGGSIRAHEPELLEATFKIMGYSDEEIQDGVGHMLEAFKVGTPPHGGIALGLDRLIMLLAGEKSLKEAIAFPMTATGRTAVMDAPSPVSQSQLATLHLQVMGKNNDQKPEERLKQFLDSSGIEYHYVEHKPVLTSQEASEARGTTMHQGAKALVLDTGDEYILFVLPADQQADLELLQKHLGIKRLALASKDTVKAKTGLEVGSIPPFGSVIGLRTYLDAALADNTEIAFNAARHDASVIMRYDDYIKLEQPQLVKHD